MPKLIVVDLETYYAVDYSLSKMPTEEYIRDDRFEVIGCAIGLGPNNVRWYPQPEVEAALRAIDWSDAMLVGQNTAFDGAILAWKYGIVPMAYADTLGMSRALYPHEMKHSLAAQAERAGLGVKGDTVHRVAGMRYADFTPYELREYGEYCVNDVVLTRALFGHYLGLGFPTKEMKLIDLTLRMYIEPVLQLDAALLHEHRNDVLATKEQLLTDLKQAFIESADPDALMAIFAPENGGIKKLLMSNEKFATLLRSFGVEPPTKISKTTGKVAYAFAKTDQEFLALRGHPDLKVAALVDARLGNKSTIEESRTERFIAMASRGNFPVPLRYYGAHSGRWSGQDAVNLQNLAARGKYKNRIKRAIKAPPGYVVIDCDSAQIEARTLAWMAGQDDLVADFAAKRDVYRIMAAAIYSCTPEEVTPLQRQVGKTVVLGCFGPDTEVLTMRGWVRIVEVLATDTVWDGVEWVTHGGVVPQGVKEVVSHYGVSATSDHEILTERGWVEWSEVCKNPLLFQSARRAASLPSFSGSAIPHPEGAGAAGTPFAGVRAGGRGLYYGRISSRGAALGAIGVQRKPRLPTENATGNTRLYARTRSLVHAYLTECRRVWRAAITRAIARINITAAGGYTCMNRGELTARSFWPISSLCRGTTTPDLSSTALTSTEATSRVTSDLSGVQPTWPTEDVSETCSSASLPSKQRMPTYDIAYAGTRNRYTIRTTGGPVVVHNCGYGVGHVKLKDYLKVNAGVDVTLDEAKSIIDTYRSKYAKIKALWTRGENALHAIANRQSFEVDVNGLCCVAELGITLPSGLHIQYPHLRRETNEEGKANWVYTSKGQPVHIYGGKVIENLGQAVARCIVAEQMLKISKRYKVVLTVHDAVAIIAKREEADEARAFVEECMSWVPKWATGLPLACESGVGASYGDC